jgi:hypothetical protein
MENLNSLETEGTPTTPEQKLWRAVFMQAIQDAFGINPVQLNTLEQRQARDWIKDFTYDFAIVCENAGFNPKQAFQKLKRYDLIKTGIIWNYTTTGRRVFKGIEVNK